MGLSDVHAHLTHPRLANDVPAIVTRAREAGVTTIVSNGLNLRDNEAVRRLAGEHPMIRPAFGFYPVDVVLPELRASGVSYPRDDEVDDVETTLAWLRTHAAEALAIGEIGLDGHWVPEALWPRQEAVFRELVALALEAGKPIIVHTRRRERRAFEILQELGATRVDWHCFGGKVRLARTIAEAGHWLSIPANAPRSESFTRMLETLPRDRLLLETDCPYLGPEPGRASEPACVAGTAEYAARLWGVPPAEVTTRLADNFTRLFGVAP